MAEKYALATYLGPGKWIFQFDMKFRKGVQAPWHLNEKQGKALEQVTAMSPDGNQKHLFDVEWHSGKKITEPVEAGGKLNFLNIREKSILAQLCKERGLDVKATDSARYLRNALKDYAQHQDESETEKLQKDLEELKNPSALKKLKEKAKNVVKGAKSKKPKKGKGAKEAPK